jgi:vacuolar-type H+-ATPase catalytic subunit A/Vma1
MMNFKEAMNSIDADKLIEAMNDDIDSIRNSDV